MFMNAYWIYRPDLGENTYECSHCHMIFTPSFEGPINMYMICPRCQSYMSTGEFR